MTALRAFVAAVLLLPIMGCGGVGGSAPPPPPPQPQPLRIVTTSVPQATTGQSYSAKLEASGGSGIYNWSLAGGTLPSGLSLTTQSNQGVITGNTAQAGNFPFTVTVHDSSTPPKSASADFTLKVVATVANNRNDSIATATVVPFDSGQVSFQASISPYADPVDIARPDLDYYQVTATAGAVVIIQVDALPGSALDPVVEVVDSAGQRFATCRDLAADDPPPDVPVVPDPTPNAFDDPCINDDRTIGGGLNSYLEFQVPGTPGTPMTFYVRVFDWRGDARPDLLYQFSLTRQ